MMGIFHSLINYCLKIYRVVAGLVQCGTIFFLIFRSGLLYYERYRYGRDGIVIRWWHEN